MNRTTGKQFIKFGSQEIAVPPVMIAYDKKGNQKLIKTTTPKHHLKVFRGKTALNLVDSNASTRVEKISRTAVIEEEKIKKPRKPRKPKQLSENNAATKIQQAIRNKRAINEFADRYVKKNILPNPLLIEAPRPKQQIIPKETPKVKQQIIAKQAVVATTSTFDATRNYTREQLDAMSEIELSDLLTRIMGSNLAPKKGVDPQVATDVYNALQRNRNRTLRARINARTQQPSTIAPGATAANMIFSTNTIAQQLEEIKQQSAIAVLGAKFKRRLNENKKQKAATKIQDTFKKLKDKNKNNKDLKYKLNRDRVKLSSTIGNLNDKIRFLEKEITETNNPKKIDKIQLRIKNTMDEIQLYTKQFGFLTNKLEKM